MQLVLEVDDGFNLGNRLQDALQLRHQLVRCDDGGDFSFVDSVGDSVLAERRIDGNDCAALLEEAMSSDHPFSASLSEQDDLIAWLDAELADSFAEVLRLQLGFDEVGPLVLAQLELLEDTTVLLKLIFLAENLSCAKTTLCLVNLCDQLKHLLECVNLVLEHLHMSFHGWVDVSVGDLSVITANDFSLQDTKDN